jgi:tetratricopeptide (TPR) repeat protein
MPKPPSSSSGRGRPPRSGAGKGGSAGRGAPRSSGRGDRPSEGPPWKRRANEAAKIKADDDAKGKKAGWGGVARKGAGRMRDTGPGDASKAFRAAAPEGRDAWEPEVWVDEGVVRGEATKAVGRGRGVPRPRRPVDEEPASDPSLRRAVAAKAADRLEGRLKDASKAFRRERFEEARSILRPLAETAPTAESVRELLGLTYYRLGRWKLAITELEAFRMLNGSTEQHPVLADCYRALGRHAKVTELWEELRAASPSAPLVAEGRIVYAGSLADQGKLEDAIEVLSASKPPNKRPQEHHLRVTYALADLHERAGDVPRARQLFGIIAAADPELGDVAARLRALK